MKRFSRFLSLGLSLSFVPCFGGQAGHTGSLRSSEDSALAIGQSKNNELTSVSDQGLSDLEIARKFSPVVVNEVFIDKDGNKPQFDSIDQVTYDVAQTKTHIYISYQIMKSWSKDIETEHLLNMVGIGITTNHPVDSEDIFVIVKKEDNGELKLAAYSTNAHGKRLIYAMPDAIDPRELDKYESANQALENGNDWKGAFGLYSGLIIRPEVQSRQDFNMKIPQAEGHPVVISSAGSHAICAARFDLSCVNANKDMTQGILVVSSEETQKALTRVPTRAQNSYKLSSSRSIVESMTFSPELKKLNVDGKADPCKSITLNVAGKDISTPLLPTHFDPTWYLNRYQPKFLSEIEAIRNTDFSRTKITSMDMVYKKAYQPWLKKIVTAPEADFFWVHGKQEGDVLTDCRRLDPAKVFKDMFPLSARDEDGKYIRYDLMNAKAAAFAK